MKIKILIGVILAALIAIILVLLLLNKNSYNIPEPAAPVREFTVGVLYQGKDFIPVIDGFKKGIAAASSKDNVRFNYHVVEVVGGTQPDFELAAKNLVETKPDVIFAVSSDVILAAQSATKEIKIPVVYAFGGDPAALGFVKGMHSSGNNLTGVTWRAWELSGKRLEILRRIDPTVKNVLVLNKADTMSTASMESIVHSAELLEFNLTTKNVATVEELQSILSGIDTTKIDALTFVTDPFFLRNIDILLSETIAKKIPVIFQDHRFAHRGALASYGAQLKSAGSQAGIIAKRVLINGESPSSIPSEASTELQLVLNEITAKKMGIVFPEDVTSIANEIISESTDSTSVDH